VDVDSSRELGRCATRSSLDEAGPRTALEDEKVLVMSMVESVYRQSCMVVLGGSQWSWRVGEKSRARWMRWR
jgi:hypothetical protein